MTGMRRVYRGSGRSERSIIKTDTYMDDYTTNLVDVTLHATIEAHLADWAAPCRMFIPCTACQTLSENV